MSKRRNENEEEEDKPFNVPKFDEEAFLKRERRNIKATFLAFLFACLMALVCFGFWALIGSGNDFRWILVFLVCIANATFIRFIYLRLNLDISDFTKKNWFMTYGVYFFTWLLVFIVLVNPPFYDDEAPMVDLVVLPGVQEPGGNITFVAKITDNNAINYDLLSLEITDPAGNKTTIQPTGFEWNKVIVNYIYENPDNLKDNFTYLFTVVDNSGRQTIKTGTFYYDEDAISVTSSRFDNITSGDDVSIDVDEGVSTENFRVYYTLDDGNQINVDRKKAEEKDEYETSPAYEGWTENGHFTMKIYAETTHYFLNIPTKYSNIVKDTTFYNFTTGIDSKIGDEENLVEHNYTLQILGKDQLPNTLNYKLPYPTYVLVPGFEAIILIAAIAVVILIFKKKNKDEKNQK